MGKVLASSPSDKVAQVVQNVIVELQYQQVPKEGGAPIGFSVFAGWTGFESKRKTPGIIGRDGGRGSKEDIAVVEISSAYGRTLGLAQGQKIGVKLHLDPPLAHTIHIEPLTPSDWESKMFWSLEEPSMC